MLQGLAEVYNGSELVDLEDSDHQFKLLLEDILVFPFALTYVIHLIIQDTISQKLHLTPELVIFLWAF